MSAATQAPVLRSDTSWYNEFHWARFHQVSLLDPEWRFVVVDDGHARLESHYHRLRIDRVESPADEDGDATFGVRYVDPTDADPDAGASPALIVSDDVAVVARVLELAVTALGRGEQPFVLSIDAAGEPVERHEFPRPELALLAGNLHRRLARAGHDADAGPNGNVDADVTGVSADVAETSAAEPVIIDVTPGVDAEDHPFADVDSAGSTGSTPTSPAEPDAPAADPAGGD